MVFDLRSDTVTCPSPQMRADMMNAKVGDSLYEEDESTLQLEEYISQLFGKEAGMFVPTGTMSNQVALKLFCLPGDTVLTSLSNHILTSETGALAALSGIQPKEPLFKEGFIIETEKLPYFYSGYSVHAPETKLVSIENTHLRSGGRVYPIEEIKKLSEVTQKLGMKLHMDGARIWHAHVAEGTSFKTYGSYFDSISVCFSKGLGAPVGSALLSTKENIRQAKKLRKMFGGTMRQCGFLSRAAMFSLKNNLPKLGEDHLKARKLAAFFRKALPQTHVPEPETNIVLIELPAQLIEKASHILSQFEKDLGFKMGQLDYNVLRAVTHLDIDATKLDEKLEKHYQISV